MGQLGAAADLYAEALRLLRPGGAPVPEDLNAAIDLGGFHHSLGLVRAARGDAEGALKSYADAVAVLEVVLAREPRSTFGVNFLREVLCSRGELNGRLGRHQECLADWQAALALTEDAGRGALELRLAAAVARTGRPHCAIAFPALTDPAYLAEKDYVSNFRIAQAYAAASGAARVGEALPSEERALAAEHYAGRALALLERAVGTGGLRWWPELVEDLRSHPDFEGLRGREDFQKLLTAIRHE